MCVGHCACVGSVNSWDDNAMGICTTICVFCHVCVLHCVCVCLCVFLWFFFGVWCVCVLVFLCVCLCVFARARWLFQVKIFFFVRFRVGS